MSGTTGTQDILDLDKLNGATAVPTFTAANFMTTDTPQSNTQPGGFISNDSGNTWADDSGEPWLQGGNADTLSYAMVAGNTEYQVITIQVTDTTTNTVVSTIYGQVVGWASGQAQIEFQGFQSFDPATGVLSQPLGPQGTPTYFVWGAQNLEGNLNLETTNTPASVRVGTLNLTRTTGTSPDGPGLLRPGTPLPCFAAGTLVATPTGPVAVEDLAVGDSVLTVSGAVQTVRWVGTTELRCDRHPTPARVTPVRIAPGAFGPSQPARPLFLSPEHAVYQDGAMVPVQCLVNGTTITQAPAQAAAYYHVELPQHDVLLAEGLPAESYLETGARIALATAGDRATTAA